MTLEGWVPEIGPYLTLDEVIEFAFDYRGNTTIVKTNGTDVVGYVFNRNRSVAIPFIQFFDEQGGGPFTLPYAESSRPSSSPGRTPRQAIAGRPGWSAGRERRPARRCLPARGSCHRP